MAFHGFSQKYDIVRRFWASINLRQFKIHFKCYSLFTSSKIFTCIPQKIKLLMHVLISITGVKLKLKYSTHAMEQQIIHFSYTVKRRPFRYGHQDLPKNVLFSSFSRQISFYKHKLKLAQCRKRRRNFFVVSRERNNKTLSENV